MPPTPPKGNGPPSTPKKWFCEVCNKEMLKTSQTKHMETETHKANLKVPASDPDRMSSASSFRSADGRSSVSSTPSEDQWYCDMCNKHMQAKSKNRHLESKSHKDKAQLSANNFPASFPDRMSSASSSRSSDGRSSVSSIPSEDQWHYDVCNKHMQAKSKIRHLESKSHIDKAQMSANNGSCSDMDVNSIRDLTGEPESQTALEVPYSDREQVNASLTGARRSSRSCSDMDVNSIRDLTGEPESQTALNVPYSDREQVNASLTGARRSSRNGPPSTPKKWFCEVCNKEMLKTSQTKHLETETHKANLKVPASDPDRMSSASSFRSADGRSSVSFTPSEDQWYCDMCNKHMQAKSKNRHLESKSHKDKAQLSANNFPASFPDRMSSASSSWSSDGRSSVTSISSEDQWHCDVCNKHMQAKSKNRHLESKSHKDKAQLSANNVPASFPDRMSSASSSWSADGRSSVSSIPSEDQWHCDVCNKHMQAKSKNRHLESKSHKDKAQLSANNVPASFLDRMSSASSSPSSDGRPSVSSIPSEDQWHCDVCNKHMQAKSKNRHLESKSHKVNAHMSANNVPASFPDRMSSASSFRSSDGRSSVRSILSEEEWECETVLYVKEEAIVRPKNLSKVDRGSCSDMDVNSIRDLTGEPESQTALKVPYSDREQVNASLTGARRSSRLEKKDMLKRNLENSQIRKVIKYSIMEPDIACSLASSQIISSEEAEELKSLYLHQKDYIKATDKMIDLFLISMTPDKWGILLSALQKNGYDYISKLLNGDEQPPENYYEAETINRFIKELTTQMVVMDILPVIVSQQLISDTDKQKIISDYKNQGQNMAAWELLIRITKRKSPKEWFHGLLTALAETCLFDLVKQMKPDFKRNDSL